MARKNKQKKRLDTIGRKQAATALHPVAFFLLLLHLLLFLLFFRLLLLFRVLFRSVAGCDVLQLLFFAASYVVRFFWSKNQLLRKGSPMKTDVDDIIFSDITNVISDLELGCGGAVVVSRLLILQIG